MAKEKAIKKEELYKFMEDFDDGDLPDGAWQAMLEDSVKHYNEANGTNYDPFDEFINYCQKQEGKPL